MKGNNVSSIIAPLNMKKKTIIRFYCYSGNGTVINRMTLHVFMKNIFITNVKSALRKEKNHRQY